mgnify:CR=1 FL=1
MKTIQLSAEKAKQLYGKNTELDEILKENFTDEELGLKKLLPKAWGEFGYIKGWFITEASRIAKAANLSPLERNRNVFATEAQANSALAYAQLTQLIEKYNDGWEPDWNNSNSIKYAIVCENNKLVCYKFYNIKTLLVFKTEELRDEFLKNFEPLIKTFYQI